jgi:hypothetical protein
MGITRVFLVHNEEHHNREIPMSSVKKIVGNIHRFVQIPRIEVFTRVKIKQLYT